MNYLLCAYKSTDDFTFVDAKPIKIFMWYSTVYNSVCVSPLRYTSTSCPGIFIVSGVADEDATFAVLSGTAFAITAHIKEQVINLDSDFDISVPDEYQQILEKILYD